MDGVEVLLVVHFVLGFPACQRLAAGVGWTPKEI